jgi:FkbM family methyltransferase
MNTTALAPRSLLAHPLVIRWRNRLRHNGLLRGMYKRWVARHDYEERFSDALLAAIRPGDVVWDVGANVGLYTERFVAGGAAHVVCFEPAPEAVRTLQSRFAHESAEGGRVRIVPIALSNVSGTVQFAADGSSPNNRILASAHSQPAAAADVPVRSGDQALREYALPAPNVVKIDVEGYEPEVIAGLTEILGSAALRAVFIEVHFALLHERGLDAAPERIVKTLQSRGMRVTWLDPSHLAAVRATA